MSMHQRRLDARGMAGFRSAHVARSTGTLVIVYRDVDEECGTGLRWVTLCDDHGHLVGHDTLALARDHSSVPETWCEVCMGVVPFDAINELAYHQETTT